MLIGGHGFGHCLQKNVGYVSLPLYSVNFVKMGVFISFIKNFCRLQQSFNFYMFY